MEGCPAAVPGGSIHTRARATRSRGAATLSQVSTDRRIYGSPAELAQAAAEYLAGVMGATVAARGRCAVALAGGRTPGPVYEQLAEPPLVTRVPWQALEVFFGDERAVGPEDPHSNYHMAASALLRRVPLDAARVHRIPAELPDREQAARDYERLLPERLDLLLLGMGADGHTASLFAGSAALGERHRRVMPVIGAGPVAQRITITPPVIAAAREVVVLVAGSEKAAAVRAALGTGGGGRGGDAATPEDLPIRLALRGTWFLTRDAASLWQEDARA